MPDWRAEVRNGPAGDKILPSLISPGGRVAYGRPKFPQLPAPSLLAIDYPYILLDNWVVRFFPVTRSAMEWFGESLALWNNQRPCREYRNELNRFVDELERLSATRPF
jgi:hypothetical protein